MSTGTVQGQYNAGTVTLTDGSIIDLQVDEHGHLKVNVADGSISLTTGNLNLTVAEYNAVTPTLNDGDTTPVQTDVNGNMKSTITNAPKISATYTAAGVTVTNGNSVALQCTATGQVLVSDSTVNTTLATTNTNLGTVNTSVAAVTTALTTTNTNLTTVNTSVGTVNTTLTAVSNKLVDDTDGNLKVVAMPNGHNEAALSWYDSTALEEKAAGTGSPGKLYSVYAVNGSVTTKYLWLFNAASATGNPFMLPIPVAPNGGTASIDLKFGKYFSTGLYFASSSTLGTYTASTTSDLMVSIGYKG